MESIANSFLAIAQLALYAARESARALRRAGPLGPRHQTSLLTLTATSARTRHHTSHEHQLRRIPDKQQHEKSVNDTILMTMKFLSRN